MPLFSRRYHRPNEFAAAVGSFHRRHFAGILSPSIADRDHFVLCSRVEPIVVLLVTPRYVSFTYLLVYTLCFYFIFAEPSSVFSRVELSRAPRAAARLAFWCVYRAIVLTHSPPRVEPILFQQLFQLSKHVKNNQLK